MSESIYHERIVQVLIHLEQHLDEDLGLDRLASIAHFSQFHFHRIFSALVGETVAAYVRRLRLERAARELLYASRSIAEIAASAGYRNPESFSRAFATAFGRSPSQFRAQLQQRSKEPALPLLRAASETRLLDVEASDLQVELVEREPQRVAFLRHVGPYPGVGATWQHLLQNVGGAIGPNTKYFGIGHDDPHVTEPQRLRYDACVTVPDDYTPPPPVALQEIAGGRHASALHLGNYSRFEETYRQIFGGWLPRSGFDLADAPPVHEYHNQAWLTPPDQLRTCILLPLSTATNDAPST